MLGAACAASVLGPRVPAWRSLLWGGVLGTLPDLDVLIDHGDPIKNMTFHRAESHALLYLTLLAPLLGQAIARWHRERALCVRWCIAAWLALITHPLLDAMTIYGTQLLLPFTDHPFAVGSLFVIDPLYTLPLLLGNVVLLGARRRERGHRWNRAGLLVSTLYAAWSMVAQAQATAVARASLAQQGIAASQLVVTPAPLQTVLWRLVAVGDDAAYEGFWSLCDADREVEWTRLDRGRELLEPLRGTWSVDRTVWFSGGCCKAERVDGHVRLTDLRMGQHPFFFFAFDVAAIAADGTFVPLAVPVRRGMRLEIARGLQWLWPRLCGERLPPPR